MHQAARREDMKKKKKKSDDERSFCALFSCGQFELIESFSIPDENVFFQADFIHFKIILFFRSFSQNTIQYRNNEIE